MKLLYTTVTLKQTAQIFTLALAVLVKLDLRGMGLFVKVRLIKENKRKSTWLVQGFKHSKNSLKLNLSLLIVTNITKRLT